MLVYLLKSGACMAVFLLFYKLFLEQENMHVFKRYFLISAILASLVIPNIVFTSYVETVSENFENLTNGPYVAVVSNEPTDIDMINWSLIITTIYFVGILFFSFRFFKNLSQILRRIKGNPNFRQASSIKVLLKEALPPHTFFNYVFLNKRKFEENAIPQEVLLHEETHAKQRHSLDVLFIELMQVILWFNPLIYLFKKAIKLNHEFLADKAVLKHEVHTKNYQNTLLSYLSKESFEKYQSTGIANAINYSSIKKRFTVMKKRTSKKAIVLRSFLLLPLTGLLLFGFSENKVIKIEKNNPRTSEIAFLVEHIDIRIDSKGNLFINDNEKIPIKNLRNHLLSLNNTLILKEREQQVSVVINVAPDTPKTIIQEVDRIVTAYGVAEINIRGQEPVYIGKLIENKTKHFQIEKYNALAKKYNAVPLEKRKIPLNDLKILERIYKGMTKIERKESQPFPECLQKIRQDGATNKQVTWYNALIKKTGKEGVFRKIDIERLEYIYNLMSDKQKANAEPFPNFVPMPEPPMPPNAPMEKEMEMQEMELVRQQKALEIQEGEMIEKEMEMEMQQKEAIMVEQKKAVENQQNSSWTVTSGANRGFRKNNKNDLPTNTNDLPLPPVAPTIAMHANTDTYSIELKKSIQSYLDLNNSYEKAVSLYTKEEKGNPENLWNLYNKVMKSYVKYNVQATEEGNFVQPIPAYKNRKTNEKSILLPPTPPEPKSPLDFAIEMAKKDAVFYYEGKKISSDKAIEILRKNKSLNMDVRNSNGKRPVVKLSKEPISIE